MSPPSRELPITFVDATHVKLGDVMFEVTGCEAVLSARAGQHHASCRPVAELAVVQHVRFERVNRELHRRLWPTREDELWRAIVDAPNDDAPRLVYADYLLERGDPAGERIVAQCRSSPIASGKLPDLPFVEVELSRGLAYALIARDLARGQVFELLASAHAEIATRIELSGGIAGDEVCRFIGRAASTCANVKVLRVRGAMVSDIGLAALLLGNCPPHVHLPENDLGRGFAHLVGRTLLPESLGLSFAELDFADIEELARASFPFLERLDLASNPIGTADWSRCSLPKLTDLDLDHCELGATGVRALARAPFTHTLRSISLVDNALDPDALAAFLGADFAELRTIWLGGNELDDRALAALGSAQLPKLAHLYFGHNDVTDSACEAFLETDVGRQLTTFDTGRAWR